MFLTIAVLGWARRRPGYQHARDTISELGEARAADSRPVSLGTFLPVGLVMLGVAALTREIAGPSAVLAACIGTGYAVAALFPCDPGSPLSGSLRHNFGGGIEYVGGALALFGLGEIHGSAFSADLRDRAFDAGLSMARRRPAGRRSDVVRCPCRLAMADLCAERVASSTAMRYQRALDL